MCERKERGPPLLVVEGRGFPSQELMGRRSHLKKDERKEEVHGEGQISPAPGEGLRLPRGQGRTGGLRQEHRTDAPIGGGSRR